MTRRSQARIEIYSPAISPAPQAVSSRAVFRQLDNQVGRLAVRLPADGDMDKMARLVRAPLLS